MKNKLAYIALLFFSFIILTSCESEVERKQRESREELQKIELEVQKKLESEELVFQQEQERQEQAIYNKFLNNSLSTGSTPYSNCFGINDSCSNYGCSKIIVKTPFNSDVLVTVKKGDKVFRHAYIDSASRFSFEIPNGTYQIFFYYGKGWNPEKVMKKADCGIIRGGFVANEIFSKDDPQKLNNEIMTYELILQENGNLQTDPSNLEEAL